ncbi:EGF-like domain protein, partial [Cooperia oncophora]
MFLISDQVENGLAACHLVGFTGKYCEQILNNICHRSSLCGSHGKCVLTSSLEEYECRCNDGWIGDHCEERNPCPPEYCNHGGKCSQNGSDFVCNCPPGFYGPQCEHDVNECDLSPCAFGKCVNT